MLRFGPLYPIILFLAAPALARHTTAVCGATAETPHEVLSLHRLSMRARALAAEPPLPAANRDAGNIAVIEDAGGVVARQNDFNLDLNTLAFIPTAPQAARYRYAVMEGGYDSAAAAAGAPLAALDDDDSRAVALPFDFPFFGATYTQVFVNSDGNLTFTAGDSASDARSLGRMTSGPPRIAPLFDDLDPSQTAGGVRVLADTSRVVVSWAGVPEWVTSGLGRKQTFQVRLYPDGRIEFSYSGVNPAAAVVGIAPGNLAGATSLVDFRGDPSADYSAAMAERFGNSLSIDIVTVAQKFYQTHQDAYDYLVIYNNEGIESLPGAVAYESTVRSSGVGYGAPAVDSGSIYGSPSRLRAVINMGHLAQYPRNPNGAVPLRQQQGDTPLTILGHEAGHLFLARASIPDPVNPASRPMLNSANLVHWGFPFNSEASLLEGERILDRGANVSPRFLTTDTVLGYSALDQYLMGLLPPEQVAPTFVVLNPPAFTLGLLPYRNISFDGNRFDVAIDDIVKAMGPRIPDYTVAQRRFRYAFILVAPEGSQPDADVGQIDTYRQQFETFFAAASSNHASADTSLARSLKLSIFPAAGVVAGGTASATIAVATPPASALIVRLQAPNGNAGLPASVTIPAGATSVSFIVAGLKAGVEEIAAIPGDPAYETAFARVQVADGALLRLTAISGDHQAPGPDGALPGPIVVLLTDANRLPYPGASLLAAASAGGSVQPSALMTDAQGQAVFRWTPGGAASNQLTIAVEALPASTLTLSAGSSVPVVTAVINSASSESGVAQGALQTVRGVNLAGGQTVQSDYPWPPTLGGVRVLLDGITLPLLYVSDAQINFYLPEDTPLGPATLVVSTPSGVRASAGVNVAAAAPGIFPDAVTTPVRAGDTVRVYCTGLGATLPGDDPRTTLLIPTVFIGSVPVQPLFSGRPSSSPGLYEVDVEVPQGLTPGPQTLLMSIGRAHSNPVQIEVQ